MTFRRKQKDTISREEFRKKLDEMGIQYREHRGEIIPMRFWGDKGYQLPVTLCNTKNDIRVHRADTLNEIKKLYEKRMESVK